MEGPARSGLKDKGNIYYPMIKSTEGPSTGSAVFTTVRNDQEQICVLILHGRALRVDPGLTPD